MGLPPNSLYATQMELLSNSPNIPVALTTLLAIETSCDETGVAIVQKSGQEINVLASAVASQTNIHELTGGVVPSAAAREHEKVLEPLITSVMAQAEVGPADLDAIAVTYGPGLQPALGVGVRAARRLSEEWNKLIVPVNHLEGHIYSALLQGEPNFPALALIVSGGHTLLVLVKDHLDYEVIGSTRDDAAGEAFDKVARLLGLPYPGGPALSRLAKSGNPAAFAFPRPMLHSGDFDFSFSGLKTAVLYTLRENKNINFSNVAAGFEQAVVDTLVSKTMKAVEQFGPVVVLLAGGVAANMQLRRQLEEAAAQEQIELRIAPPELCGDNAVMIGQVGLFAYEAGRRAQANALEPIARLVLAPALAR